MAKTCLSPGQVSVSQYTSLDYDVLQSIMATPWLHLHRPYFQIRFEKRNISYRISKQGCQSSVIAAHQWEPLNLKEIRKKSICHLSAIRLRPFPTVSYEELRMWKHRILAPGSWDAYQRNVFSEPRLLHIPVHRKVLNFLTWDILFSSINSQFLMFWLPARPWKTPIYPHSPPHFLRDGDTG